MDSRIEVIKGRITDLKVDAIISPTNSSFQIITGNNYEIIHQAGDNLVSELQERSHSAAGYVVITDGYELLSGKIIHLIGPSESDPDEERIELLRKAYTEVFKYTYDNKLKTIALGELGNSIYNIPRYVKLRIIVNTVKKALQTNPTLEKIYIVCATEKGLNIFRLFLSINTESEEYLADLLNVMDKKTRRLTDSLVKSVDLEHNQRQSIEDSMKYARRIQEAISPGEGIYKSSFKDYFILSKPRNIVSGDFPWITKKENKVIVAAADCTGHGIPGALLSMLGITFLNEIVNSKRIFDPSEILNSLRQYIVKTLQQTGSESEAHDGLDIALCSIDYKDNILTFSGAFNPLYLVRDKNLTDLNLFSGNNKNENIIVNRDISDKLDLIEIKGDRMSVSINPLMEQFDRDIQTYILKRKLYLTLLRSKYSFKETKIKIFPGDEFYILSDGYMDQFGGPDGKKFRSQNFKKLIISLYNRKGDDKKTIINQTFESWKRNFEQVDDVLVLGFKL
jgi:O-acetyl-ADP-ribose deacetylase (regulator of RNase III)